MRVLLVGSGGREHAIAWKLAQASTIDLHAAPGSPGIARLGECHPIRADDAEGLLALAHALDVDLVVVGPEAPLVAGIADVLRPAGIAVFGPSAAAAAIEGSKTFAKEVMGAAGVPTAAPLAIARPPCVVKADGLAAGKGVHVCHTQAQLEAALRAVTALGGAFVVEELLEGPEVSLLAVCDGHRAVALVPAQDFKRAFDGDVGPNTGGMGTYAPVPGLDDAAVEELIAEIHEPVLAELGRRGAPFVGVLFAGLMLTAQGPRVLEFNCRLGDPEAQSVLPLLEGDLLDVVAAAAAGEVGGTTLASSAGLAESRRSDGGPAEPDAPGTPDAAHGPETAASAVTVVLAAAGYPESGNRGSPIAGIEEAESAGALVFHAGTALQGDRLVTNGGRILGVTGLGATIADARSAAYAAADLITFEGVRRRDDIALAAAAGKAVVLQRPLTSPRPDENGGS
jgi:phosphoribosylamine---glycine ligase